MDGIKEPAYLQTKPALDHTNLAGLLQSGRNDIFFNDFAACLQCNEHFIFFEFLCESEDNCSVYLLPPGKLITYDKLLARLGHQGMVILASHQVTHQRPIDTLHDVTGFSVIVRRDHKLIESAGMPARKWHTFLQWANDNHDQWPELENTSWFTKGVR